MASFDVVLRGPIPNSTHDSILRTMHSNEFTQSLLSVAKSRKTIVGSCDGGGSSD